MADSMASTSIASSETLDAATRRPISELLSETFSTFDHHAKVVTPFDNETKRDAEFVQKLNSMLLELILEFHAWSAARPAYVSDKTADVLEKEVGVLLDAEKEQGRSSHSASCVSASRSFVENTRQKLNDFVTRIKLALAALTGLAA